MSFTDNSKFFKNEACPYFPCHNVSDTENFNCLFCYCPLYMLADKCGGNFTVLENGVKDCSGCLLPHSKAFADYVFSKFDLISETEIKNRKKAPF